MKKFKHLGITTMLFACFGFMACNDDNGLSEATITPEQEVDLGLSVNWAGWNLGATSPEESGDYYAWGETQTKDTYYWSSYNMYDKEALIRIQDTEKLIKYQEYMLSINGIISGSLGENVIEGIVAKDVATANWGDGWRMPTRDEIKELIEGCSWTWCTYNGVTGYKVEGANGKSIFLPAAGCYKGPSLNNKGKFGLYWSGQWYDYWRDPLDDKYYTTKAFCLDLGIKDENRFYDYSINCYDYHLGFSIRPVKSK